MTMPTPLPSPTDAAAHLQRLYARYQASEVFGEIISPKIARGRIEEAELVMYVFERVGQGNGDHVRAWAIGQGSPCGVALAAADDGQPLRVLIAGLIKGERPLPPVHS